MRKQFSPYNLFLKVTLLIPYENSSFVNSRLMGPTVVPFAFHHDINIKLAKIELYNQYYYRNNKIDLQLLLVCGIVTIIYALS